MRPFFRFQTWRCGSCRRFHPISREPSRSGHFRLLLFHSMLLLHRHKASVRNKWAFCPANVQSDMSILVRERQRICTSYWFSHRNSSYNVRQDDVPVSDIAFRRTVAVATGVIYAGVISRLWWPSEARKELSSALSS